MNTECAKSKSGKHEKVYANYVLASCPPQYPWICRICKYEGRDVDESLFDTRPNYEDLKKQKKEEEQ